MSDNIQVTSHNSYGSRIGNSFKSIFSGIILVIASIILLVRNENNYVKQMAALKEGASLVNETHSNQINSDLEGKEVHLYGETSSDDEALQDNVFGIISNDLKLKRTVEMYQWYEESSESCTDNFGGSEDCTTTYDYHKKWSENVIDSNSFYSVSGHENPSYREYTSTEQEKSPITLGVYTLSRVFVDQLTNYTNINLNDQNISIPEQYKSTTTTTENTTTETISNDIESNNNDYLFGESDSSEESSVSNTESTSSSTNDKFHILSNYIYIGQNPSDPVIGDLKITFSSVKPGSISIVGKQMGNELTSYTVSNGRSIALLMEGNVSAEDMFLAAQKANKTITRIIRLVGLVLMFCGFSAMLKFIETLAKVLPFLANIIGVGTSIIALGLTLVVGFVTIGLARIAVRPIVGICCLVIATLGVYLLIKSKKSKKANPQNETIKEEKSDFVEVRE